MPRNRVTVPDNFPKFLLPADAVVHLRPGLTPPPNDAGDAPAPSTANRQDQP